MYHMRGTLEVALRLTFILAISTALMRPRRPKQYCLQLVIYTFIYIYVYLYISIYISIYIYTPVYKNIAISEIYIIYMYECRKKTQARWRHITPAPWCGHYLQLFFFDMHIVFSGADKKDTGAEKV